MVCVSPDAVERRSGEADHDRHHGQQREGRQEQQSERQDEQHEVRTAPAPYEGIRERVDESVHGEIDGPLDTVRGEEPRPVRAGTRHIESGRPPSEWGRS